MYFDFTFELQAACPYWLWTVSGQEEIIPNSLFMICTLFPANFNNYGLSCNPATYNIPVPPLHSVVTWASFRNVLVKILFFQRRLIRGCVTEVYLTTVNNYYRLITYLIRDLEWLC